MAIIYFIKRMSREYKCKLCPNILSKYIASSICGNCDCDLSIKRYVKNTNEEDKCKALIPKDYKFDYVNNGCNKYYYREALTKIQFSIPKLISKMPLTQLIQEIREIKLKLNKFLVKDLLNIVIGYTDQLLEYDMRQHRIKEYPIRY